MLAVAESAQDAIERFNALCNSCTAYASAERRLKQCPTCNIETMRNATLVDETRRLNARGRG
ncbi:hypothetical protein CIG75_19235 [Tumebacillus algifaecis]|uniref:Uncharacterized protein n=1 Tax=Tumebacillus algifaecis TaxID=1214604 RepID=A0A223D5J7_9BACL|nr:hypothetical protein [Tumebacillus algifaecis]ASS76868.1 hypothetical protein CIG75_19235 [Tumebacillus algifaecis]